MTTTLMVIGKTNIDFVNLGVAEYTKRLSRYTKFNIVTLPDIKGAKNMSISDIKAREGEMLCSALSGYDYIVLLDERGKERTSEEFASWIEQCTIQSTKQIVFVIGGAYGFSEPIYNMHRELISLSKMTFSHQMIRLIFTEQLYRAYTIIKGEPYHHK